MRLADLKPEFVRFSSELVTVSMHKREVVTTLSEAQGIRFRSPGNLDLALCIPFSGRGAPADENGGIQWGVSATGFADLTLTPSVNTRQWHGFVINGEVTSC
ncbi:TPA: hypothetical protein VDB83_001138 [Burkholderia cenocepacia]|uniref:hypothetical protein n=1 Tax=Burkholderia cenocepacia TaxID=95486 RepID=UPI001B99625F|nr:hypothetical protein [Burkholderia cenocepacia]MBR8096298.1 hypothetical protein [Burkholderia cenocepacia]HEP6426867.1 hypothetical protein [Burkholderia cenocepacia]